MTNLSEIYLQKISPQICSRKGEIGKFNDQITKHLQFMKKLLLSVTTVLFFFGCKNNESYLPVEKIALKDGEKISSGLNAIYSDAMNFTKQQQLIFKIGKVENTEIFTYNSARALQGVTEHLNDEIFKQESATLARDISFISNANRNFTARVADSESVESLFDTTSIYSDQEKKLLIDLTNNLLKSENPENEAAEIILSFEKEVNGLSTLSEQEKIVLLNYSAMYESFFKFVQDGGVENVYMSMASALPSTGIASNARTTGCKINTRGLLIGAVYSGVKGAIGGALIGAAGGTVTLPGVGTVTGAVGGGVFGAASGFTWGIIDGVATQLLETCFRYVLSQDVQCARIFEQLENGTIEPSTALVNANPACFQIDKSDLYLIVN